MNRAPSKLVCPCPGHELCRGRDARLGQDPEYGSDRTQFSPESMAP